MGKQTRRSFLAVSGAVTAAVLVGCAAGAPPNSTYQGTYRSVYAIPGLGETGTFNYSIEQKGKITGSFVDANTSKVWSFNGTVTNNGKFDGSLSDGSQTSPVSGTLSNSGGNFEVTRGGQAQRGDFQVDGTLNETQSAYQGIYSGVYNIPGLTLSGINSFTVDSRGNITGSLTRGTETGLLTGTIGNSGAFTATIKFNSETLPMAGSLVKTSDNSSQGNFTVTKGGLTYPATFGKSDSVVAGGDSPYKGAYRGVYNVPQRGEDGNISFTVDPSGTILGFFNEVNSKPVGTFVGAFQQDGSFAGTVTYPTGSPAPYDQPRAIVGKLAQGENGAAGDFTITVAGINYAGSIEATVGGSESDSRYRGSYNDAGFVPGFTWSGNVPAKLPQVRNFNTVGGGPGLRAGINIDKEGRFIGVVDVYTFDGKVYNDGRVIAEIADPANPTVKYPVRGILTGNQLTYVESYDTDGKPVFATKPGIVCDFIVTVDGVEYRSNLTALGGDGTNP